jgi:hypothetical protein
MICNIYQILSGLKKEKQCTYKRNIQAHSRNHFSRGKAIRISYSECVSVPLNIQHAKRTRRIVLLSMACPGLTNFPRNFINGTIVGQKWVFWFSLQILCAKFLLLTRIKGDITINADTSSNKVPAILSTFSSNLNNLARFSKNTQISHFMKTRPVGAEWQQPGSSAQTAQTTTVPLMSYFIDSKEFMYLYIRVL